MFCLAVVLVATVAALGSAQLPDQAYQDPYFGGYPAVYAGYPSGQYQEAYQGVQQPVYSQLQQSTFPGVQQGIYHDPATSLGSPAALSFPTIAPVTHVPIDSQYQALDEYGQYTFGFTGGDIGRTETRDAQGNVQGSYEYIDSDGNVQTQYYVADEFGFRVTGSNLPQAGALRHPTAPAVTASPLKPVQDTPEVAAAKEAFVKAYNEAAIAAAQAPDTR